MTPIKEGEMPAVRKRWTSWVRRVASRGLVMRFPFTVSVARARRVSVLKKRTLLSGSRVWERWHEGEEGPGQGDLGQSCEAIEPGAVEK